jgi:hypothetical protein
MADCEKCSSIFVDESRKKKQEEKCSGCTELIVELQKVKSEILSYGEIIKVLQEEELLNKAGSLDYNEDYNDCYVNQIKAHPPKEDWIQSIERKPEKDNY